jgi:hypothetical protein
VQCDLRHVRNRLEARIRPDEGLAVAYHGGRLGTALPARKGS